MVDKARPDSVASGGGIKKVLYTLSTVNRIGLKNSAKALTAKNACKACGLGMGGQLGGMTNELGEFPSVCNKSVQAQSTDIQPPIPSEIFAHTLDDLRDLSGRELENLGRLGTPIYKGSMDQRYQEVTWEFAINKASEAFRRTSADRSFFYCSGRSSNEAGFVLQLLARLYGTNNVSNCSYYCHQATSVALENTIGTGTATVELEDLEGCDLFFLIGANPASNHPRLMHKLIELRRRGGHVIVINPMREAGLVKFAAPKMVSSMLNGGDEVASLYVQPKVGSDVYLFLGIAKAVDELGGLDLNFVDSHTSQSESFLTLVRSHDWEEIFESCGAMREEIQAIAELYCASSNSVFGWGMGMTHHLHGVANIEWISNLALLRGMVGKRHSGLLPLRGHSNVQGIGTVGVKPVLGEEVMKQIERELGVTLPKSSGMHTLASLEASYRGEIDVALIMGGNLYEASPNTQWSGDALDRIGTKIFLTTTLNKGHVHSVDSGEVIVFPVCARDEEPEPTTQESMFNYVRLSDGGIERIADARSETSVLVELGKNILPPLPFNFEEFRGHQRVREAVSRVVPGMEELKDIQVAKREFHVRGRVLHTRVFKTDSGRVAFVPNLPTEETSERPFKLMSIRSEGQFNSIVYEEKDTYRGAKQRWVVYMNQQDALELGVGEGSVVDIESDQGVMSSVHVRIASLPRNSVACYYPEANVLTALAVDDRSFTPAFKSVPVSVIKS